MTEVAPEPDEDSIAYALAPVRASIYWLGRMSRGIDWCLNPVAQSDADAPDWEGLDADDREGLAVDLYHTVDLNMSITNVLEIGEPWRARILPGPLEAKLRFKVGEYQSRLPFSEGEGIWLNNEYLDPDLEHREFVRGQPHPSLTPAVRVLRAKDAKFPDPGGGRLTSRSGAEITDRWWDWRRGVGEFAVRSTRDRAREALYELQELIGGAWVDGDWLAATGEA
jgi:hypothetical protein